MKRERVFQILFNLSSWTKELVWSVGSRGAKTRCWAWWSAPTEREPGRGWLRVGSIYNAEVCGRRLPVCNEKQSLPRIASRRDLRCVPTCFTRPNFPKPKTRLFFRDQIFRNRNRNPQKFGKSLETES